MTALLYLLNISALTGQAALSREYGTKGGDTNNFNINMALSGVIAFLCFCLVGGFKLHLPTLMFGAVYGVALCLSMYTGFKALATGPMALTSIIASFSLIIPFVFGVTVWNEVVTVYGMVGVILLLAAIVLINMKKEGNTTLKWLIYALLTLLTNGVCSIVQKYHQLYYPTLYRSEFMLFALFTVLVILVAVKLLGKKQVPFKFSWMGLASGALNGAANYSVMLLVATQNASVLFPVLSVGKIIAVWLWGRLVYKEDLKPTQLIGLVLGTAAIVLLNIK